MKNTFGWMQLQTQDAEKAQSFYQHLFQWKFDKQPMSDDSTFIEIDAGEGPCAGIGESAFQNGWIPFVHVKDIQESTQKAESLGAEVVISPTAIDGDQGFYSVFIDPAGATLGLYEPPK